MTADDRGHPVCRSAGQSSVGRLALEVVQRRNRCEAFAVVQAVHINDRLSSSSQFRDCRDEDATALADQKIAGAGSEAVVLDKRPVIRRNLKVALRVRDHTWPVAAAERASAFAERTIFWPLRKSKTDINVSAVTPAQMFHAVDSLLSVDICQVA